MRFHAWTLPVSVVCCAEFVRSQDLKLRSRIYMYVLWLYCLLSFMPIYVIYSPVFLQLSGTNTGTHTRTCTQILQVTCLLYGCRPQCPKCTLLYGWIYSTLLICDVTCRTVRPWPCECSLLVTVVSMCETANDQHLTSSYCNKFKQEVQNVARSVWRLPSLYVCWG